MNTLHSEYIPRVLVPLQSFPQSNINILSGGFGSGKTSYLYNQIITENPSTRIYAEWKSLLEMINFSASTLFGFICRVKGFHLVNCNDEATAFEKIFKERRIEDFEFGENTYEVVMLFNSYANGEVTLCIDNYNDYDVADSNFLENISIYCKVWISTSLKAGILLMEDLECNAYSLGPLSKHECRKIFYDSTSGYYDSMEEGLVVAKYIFKKVKAGGGKYFLESPLHIKIVATAMMACPEEPIVEKKIINVLFGCLTKHLEEKIGTSIVDKNWYQELINLKCSEQKMKMYLNELGFSKVNVLRYPWYEASFAKVASQCTHNDITFLGKENYLYESEYCKNKSKVYCQ